MATSGGRLAARSPVGGLGWRQGARRGLLNERRSASRSGDRGSPADSAPGEARGSGRTALKDVLPSPRGSLFDVRGHPNLDHLPPGARSRENKVVGIHGPPTRTDWPSDNQNVCRVCMGRLMQPACLRTAGAVIWDPDNDVGELSAGTASPIRRRIRPRHPDVSRRNAVLIQILLDAASEPHPSEGRLTR